MTRYRFSREELYELVWSEPMSKLSKRLGVSDRGLAKACARANIPAPGRGYWAQLQHGKKVEREPLPQAELGIATTVEIIPGPQRSLLSELPPEVLELITKESSPDLRITVSRTLSNPHPLVRSWLEHDRRKRRETLTWPFSPAKSSYRTTQTENRRLRILSTLLKELEKRGHKVRGDPQDRGKFYVVCGTEEVEFALSQRYTIVEDLTHETKRNVQRPTDELILKIRSWLEPGTRTKWADRIGRPLEDQLNDAIKGVLVASAVLQRRRREREQEEQRRRAAELERLAREQQEREESRRLSVLLERIDRWRRAIDIRTYVNAVREAARIRQYTDSNRLEAWASWALSHADQIDPLVSEDFPMPTPTP